MPAILILTLCVVGLLAALPVAARAEPAATTLSLAATPTIVRWGQPWALSGELRTATFEAIPGAPVDLQRSTDQGITWTGVIALAAEPGTSYYLAAVAAPKRKTQYRLVYGGADGI